MVKIMLSNNTPVNQLVIIQIEPSPVPCLEGVGRPLEKVALHARDSGVPGRVRQSHGVAGLALLARRVATRQRRVTAVHDGVPVLHLLL